MPDDFKAGDKLFDGDICDVFDCSYTEEAKLPPHPTVYDRVAFEDDEVIEHQAVLKKARDSVDNDLVENEFLVLSKLYPPGQTEEKFYRFLPRLIGHGRQGGRAFNVITRYDEYISVEAILEAYPNGVDFKDMVWMYKRTLAGLAFVHAQGFVHGAIVPSHILVHPVEHGARIVDWSYAVTHPGQHIKAAIPKWQHFYAPEVFQKQNASPATDIYMATKCAIALVGGDVQTNEMPDSVPAALQDFFRHLLGHVHRRRLDDYLVYHEELDQLLAQVVGKRQYRPFQMPQVGV